MLDILYNEIQNYWLTFKTKEQRPLHLLGVKMSIIYDARCELYKEEIIYCACINRQAYDIENTPSSAPLINSQYPIYSEHIVSVGPELLTSHRNVNSCVTCYFVSH